MLAKKFALAFGVAVVFPAMIHYAVSSFSPEPRWSDYHTTALIDQNNRQGIVERVQNSVDSVVVGQLADPNDSSAVWAVKETGHASISYVSKSDQSVVRQQAVRFESTFWLVLKGDRYLITDALVQTKPQP